MALGGGHGCAPCRIEEACQGQADHGVVPSDHLGVCHAAGPDASPQGPWQEGLADQEGVHPVPGRVERGVMYSAPPAVAPRKPQASQPAQKCSVAGLVVASL